MNLTRPLPQLHGMGAGPSFTDTGDGIMPANFQSTCCGGVFGSQPDAAHLIACAKFKAANESIFGTCVPWYGFGTAPCTPCSTEAGVALSYGSLPEKVLPVQPPPVDMNPESPTYGKAINPCTGMLVDADSADIADCLATRQGEAQRVADLATAGNILSVQCRNIKDECAARTFGLFLSPNKNCSDCTFDFLKPGSLFLIAGGLLVGGLILVKLLK